MSTSRRAATGLARRFGLGEAIAILDLTIAEVIWTKSGGPEHITVWAPPELLLACVLQCESHDH